MKGIIFTQFLAMVEEEFSLELCDRIIESLELSTGGAYTTVGTYPAAEMFALVAALGEESGTPVPDLLRHFGRYLFPRLASHEAHLISNVSSAFELIELIEGSIHVEVRKLYDDTELPSIVARRLDPGRLEVTYSSPRNLPDLAEGLLEGALEYFGEEARIERLPADPEAGGPNPTVRFLLTRMA